MLKAKNLSTSNVARNDLARIFYRKDCTQKFQFLNCVALDGLSQDRDVTDVWCPSDDEYGKFDRITAIAGEISRLTSTLTGRLSRTEISLLYKLFIQKCPLEIKVNLGKCNDPSDNNDFEKSLILNNVFLTSYGTDPLIAINPGDRSIINENVDISAGTMFEIMSLNVKTNQDVVVPYAEGPIVDNALITYSPACDKCPDGYEFYLEYRPYECPDGEWSVNPYIIYSNDNGRTYQDIDLSYIFSAVGIDCTLPDLLLHGASINFDGTNIIISTHNVQLFIPESRLDTAGPLTELFYLVILGDWNVLDADHFFKTSIAVGTSGGITVVSDLYDVFPLNPQATTEDLYSVDMIDENEFIVGGQNGVFIFGDASVGLDLIPIIVNGVTITDDIYNVEAISGNCWLAATQNTMYMTTDYGQTWAAVFSNNNECIADISMLTHTVGYMLTNNPTLQRPYLYQTADGGYSWRRLNMAADISDGVILNKVNASINDVNKVIASGWVPIIYPADPCDPYITFDPANGDSGYAVKTFYYGE